MLAKLIKHDPNMHIDAFKMSPTHVLVSEMANMTVINRTNTRSDAWKYKSMEFGTWKQFFPVIFEQYLVS